MTGCFRSTGVSALLIRPTTRIIPPWSTNGSSLYSELVFRNARFLFLAWFLFVSPSVTFRSQRIWSSSRKCSYWKHLMMVFSASWSSGSVTLSIDYSTFVLDLVTGLSGFLISHLWSLDFRRKHRAMTFIARYQLDTPSSPHISNWSGNGATLLTFVVKTDTFFTSGSESWRRGSSTFSGSQGPLLHKNSGPVNHRDPSTSCLTVSPLDASSTGLLFVST